MSRSAATRASPTGAQVARLPGTPGEVDRLHLHHGPIDVVISMRGAPAVVQCAINDVSNVFADLLPGLVADLSVLRSGLDANTVASRARAVTSPIARRMITTAVRFLPQTDFLTPMIGVAGAVADYLLRVAVRDGLDTVIVNNGGDIALYLAPGQRVRVGIVDCVDRLQAAGAVEFGSSEDREAQRFGVATSGWRGRSFSFGIADAVTTVARSALEADVAATLIANAVNVDAPAIQRTPAAALQMDSDLGNRLVTTACPALPAPAIDQALGSGTALAQRLLASQLILGNLISLQGQQTTLGEFRMTPPCPDLITHYA